MGLVRGPAGRTPSPSPTFDAAWARALDELELEVDRAEALLSAEHARTGEPGHALGAWVPPRLATPLPDTMVERAERLLERQLLVAGRLAAAMTSSRRHLDVVERLVDADPRPMYVDQVF